MPCKIVTREEWTRARLDLLREEKEVTRKIDELAKLRSDLPIVKVTTDYIFTGPSGATTLSEIFNSQKQLIVYHAMFDPAWDGACKSCSFLIDQLPQHLEVLRKRDTELVLVSRAPIEKLDAFKKRMGWTMPWYSSGESNFNYDFHATQDESVVPVEYNYMDKDALKAKGHEFMGKGEVPGLSVFVKGEHDGEVYHTYSTYSRGLDKLLTTYSLLDMTPLGRQEPGTGVDAQPGGSKYRDEM